MFSDISLTVLSIFLIMLPGYVAAKCGMLDENSMKNLSSLVVSFLYPCLIFSSIVGGFNFDELVSLWFLPVACFGIMLTGFIVGAIFIVLFRINDGNLRKSFHFQCVMNNYSFLPLPIAYALYGDRGAGAVILASVGGELAAWTLGIGILRGFSLKKETLRHLLTPPLVSLYISLLIALLLKLAETNANNLCSENMILRMPMNTAKVLAGATIPIAMIICGARMAFLHPNKLLKLNIFIMALLRLIAVPLIVISILSILPIDRVWLNVLLIIAVMPTSAASIVLSEIYGGDKDFMVSTFIATHITGIFTIPVVLSIFLQ